VVDGGRSVGSGIVAAIEGTGRPGAIADRMERANAEQDAAAWWSELDADRERLFARVREANGDEHLDVTWEHPMFGPLNWREWLLFLRIHDLDHARQIQAVTQTLG
jgi:hypothetical protein